MIAMQQDGQQAGCAATGLGSYASLAPENQVLAREGYEMFFQAFCMDDPITYITLENFCQKHFGNPDILACPGIVAHDGKVPVAAQFYLGTRLLHKGQEVVCAQAADTAATQAGRGLPFLRMFVEGDRIQRENGVPLRIGTPNENSFPVVTKLQDRHIGSFAYLACDVAEQPAKSPAGSGSLWVEASKGFSFDDDDLAAMNRPSARIKTKKSKEVYAWKLGCLAPQKSFVSYRVLAGAGLAGFFIVRQDSAKVGTVCDWDIFPGAHGGSEEGWGAEAEQVAAAFLHAASQRFDRLELPCMNPASPECALMQSFGFAPVLREDGSPVLDPLCVTPYDEGLDADFLDFDAWQLRMLDLDYSLNCYQRF